ncbi:MAG: hypothetical protein JO154_11425 [Chitinophaga sp.]|uniref:hypothetical protein n=1 Tax=Chitinophaga sp. TaxID=1869181 RepID=UPI0025B95DCE|nr:hypothetical protein [Chitinophaga sp.]MBV8253207.1 hypothetical protein [Chitinophaga sp.]
MQSKTMIGFQECDAALARNVASGKVDLPLTDDDYRLGKGIYFCEVRQPRPDVEDQENKMTVIGGMMHLGHCLDLEDPQCQEVAKLCFDNLVNIATKMGYVFPTQDDNIQEILEGAAIEYLHQLNESFGLMPYDSVRKWIVAGKEIYPGSRFKDQTRNQVCIRNRDCIDMLFIPNSLEFIRSYDRS